MTGSITRGATSQLADGTAAGSWVLDPAGSTAEFRVRHFWGAITVRGTLGPMAGEAAVSPDGTVTGRISFDARSLDTGHKQRDKHLRSADFFDSGKHADITFTADGIRPAGQGVAVAGKLTVRGRTQPLSFGAAASIRDDGEIWLDADVRVNRADFGLTWNQLGMVSMTSSLAIHAVFTRQ